MKLRLSTIVVSLAVLTSPAAGFLPGVGSDSFFPNLLLNIAAPRTVSHADQTKRGILAFLEQHYGIDNPQYGFEPGFFRDKLPRSVKVARNLIVDANEGVDGNKHGFREKDYGPAHFDDEYFEEGQNHLMMLRSQMIQMTRDGFQTYFFDTNVNQARIFLGRQLHTLQDFYAHSNWVEMGKTTISDVVGRPGASVYPRTPAGVPTCSQYCINPSSLTDQARTQYMAMLGCYRGCFRGDSSSSELLASRRCAIGCAEPDLFCRVSTECETHACANNTLELERVTSGYYQVRDDPKSVKPAGKCSHGGLSDNGATGLEGINKDSTFETYSPHWFLHRAAAKLATEHTKKYLLDFLQDWPTVTINGTEYPQPKLTEAQLRMLLGLNPSPLAIVIDRSRSMATALGPLKSAIETMVRRLQAMGFSPPAYVLVTYGLYPLDEATDVLETPDINVFLEKLMSITPESDMTPTCAHERYEEGIIHAARRVSDRSQILVFTDRPAKEMGGSRSNPDGYPYLPEAPAATQQFRSAMFREYKSLADPKGIDTFVFEIPNQPGYPYLEHPWEVCRLAPTAPGYENSLSSFGTSFVRYPVRANLGGLASAAINQMMRVTSRGPGSHAQDLWYETQSITSTGTAEQEAAERELFVDPSVESLTLTVWDEIESQQDVTNLILTRPDGTTVGETDSDGGWHWDAPLTTSKGSRVIVIDSPQPGPWRITRRRARTGVQVVMSTSISFTFDFVEDDYFSDIHPGWQLASPRNYGEQAGLTLSFNRYQTWRLPRNYTMRAQLDGPIGSVEGFYLHAYDSGAVIMQLNMTRINDFGDDEDDFNTGDQIYFGILDAASLPYCGDFFASVVGTDRNGARFQRTEVGVYTNLFVRAEPPDLRSARLERSLPRRRHRAPLCCRL